jgi:hypothetical protein
MSRKPDTNYFEYKKPLLGAVIEPKNSEDYDDILKASGKDPVTVNYANINLLGGRNREDGIDINKCDNVTLNGINVRAGHKYAVTIKGGCSNVLLKDILVYQGLSYEGVDIDIGNWSDQSMKQCNRIVLANLRRTDGEPVRVRVGHSERPIIEGGNVRILFWKSLTLKAYLLLKWLLLKVGVTI